MLGRLSLEHVFVTVWIEELYPARPSETTILVPDTGFAEICLDSLIFIVTTSGLAQ